jgi:hypothetical protein
MGALEVSFTQAARFICKLRGGSQPVLVETSDGSLVVLKFKNNPQGPNVLFNECAGQELYRACGLQVVPWLPVEVSDAFLDRYPESWMMTAAGLTRPKAGLCYGSRYLGGQDVRLLEVLPGSSLSRIRNRSDFWLAWLVDVCAVHSDARQALYIQNGSGEIFAHFVDMGNMFGGPSGLDQPQLLASRYLDPRVYPEVTPTLARSLLRRLQNIETESIWKNIKNIPEEWQSISAIRSLLETLSRLENGQLLQQFLEMMIASHLQRGEHGQHMDQDESPLRTSVLHPRISSRRVRRKTVFLPGAARLACH